MSINGFDFTFANVLLVLGWIFGTTLVSGLLTAVLNYFWVSRVVKKTVLKQKQIGKTLAEYGLDEVLCDDGKFTKKDKSLIFGLKGEPVPSSLDFFYITGAHFFKEEFGFISKSDSKGDLPKSIFDKKNDRIRRLLDSGCNIRILLAKPSCDISKDIDEYNKSKSHYMTEMLQDEMDGENHGAKYHSASFLDRTSVLSRLPKLVNEFDCAKRQDETDKILYDEMKGRGDQNKQVWDINEMVSELRSESHKGNIELRYYTDEYRLPITIMKREHKNEEEHYLWTNITAASQESINAIRMRFYKSNKSKCLFVDENERTFEFVWKHSIPSDSLKSE